MKFTKMHGIGNDYVYVNGFEETLSNEREAAVFLSNRNFGIGSDGLIIIKPSEIADFQMVMYNADGSRGEMCGNGIRCVAKYVYEKDLTDKTMFTIESMGNVRTVQLATQGNTVSLIKVDMGAPELRCTEIPVALDMEQAVSQPIEIDGTEYRFTAVSMGNPHAVIFRDGIDDLNLEQIGPKFEHHALFPNRINTEFVEVLDRRTVNMRVWERGSGETLACGSGACAVAVACVLEGRTEPDVTVKLLGGDLRVQWDRKQNTVYLTGTATTVFDGEIEL